jgi:hypothetical protein
LFCDRTAPHTGEVAPIDRKQRAERQVRTLLEDCGLPAPDEVEYGKTCVRFLWLDPKVALVVDLEDLEEIDAAGGNTIDGLTI